MDFTRVLHALLRKAPRDRHVAPPGQNFSFATHHGKVRKDNQDTAIVLVGRRMDGKSPFLAAILCDGMGGLEHGDEAADLAAAAVGAVIASDDRLGVTQRMDKAIRTANAVVFKEFRGRAGTVLVAVLIEDQQAVIGWVGDARVYGLAPGHAPKLLTHDDTVATEVERVEGPAPDAMNMLLRAIGVKQNVSPHVIPLDTGFQAILLASDGVHRIDAAAMAWVDRNARTPSELALRLVTASQWEGGHDNGTALVVELDRPVSLDEEGEVLAAWVETHPRIWQTLRARPDVGSQPVVQVRPHAAAPRTSSSEKSKKRFKGADSAANSPLKDDSSPKRTLQQQTPLNIELGDKLKDER